MSSPRPLSGCEDRRRRAAVPGIVAPRRARCRRPARDRGAAARIASLLDESRVYLGVRATEGAGVTVVGPGPQDRAALDVPGALWGRPGPGADRLAAALIDDATGRAPDAATASAFAGEILGRLPPGGFALSAVEIRAWVVLHRVRPGAPRG
ncbi:hypothetical protein FSW04_24940 [Baekduia soli]|uniref:Uncharacterized protein n=1 Tax=Baekduia soli TaxID=496014 RepID=A0A5B8UBS0_9ACTN|nr:hypothetical protein [Baekduia soli]QEC50505.1 hypothetical protein FSW04_24940 [Baekduia soli]